MAEDSTNAEAAIDLTAVFAVFLIVLGLTYSDDAVEFVSVVTGHGSPAAQWAVFLVDVALVLGAAGLKWRITARGRGGATLGWREFLPLLLRSWWSVGAVMVVVLHRAVAALGSSLAVTLVLSTLFVVAMGLVLLGALDPGDDPGKTASRGWIVPLVIGTLVVQIASALWFPIIDVAGDCANQVAPDFFGAVVNVIPMLLVPLGIELGFLRQRGKLHGPGPRAAPILTVIMLASGEALAFSMLVSLADVRCGLAAVWHEYISFVVSVQSMAIALATLVWLLLVAAGE